MLDICTIDSTKIRIPFVECKILNESVLSRWVMVNETTGEVSNTDFKSNCYTHQQNGIKLRIGIETKGVSVVQKGEHLNLSKYVTMVITSKMLRKDYFKGITKETLPIVYDYVMSLNVFSCSYDSFCNSMATDTDICKDFKASFEDMRELMKSLEKHSNPYTQKGIGVRAYIDGKNQNGIEWNDRNTTSLRHPFVKVYSKYLDLYGQGIKQDRRDFAQSYITEEETKDLYRVEVTLKNRKAFKAYGITNTTLLDIVSLSQDKMSDMLSKTVNKNISKPSSKPNKPKEGMTPQERFIYNGLSMILQTTPYGIAIELMTEDLPSSSKTKYIQKVNAIYVKWIKGQETYKTENIDTLMKAVGWVG